MPKSASPLGRMLVRDYIQSSLYHPTLGYFSTCPLLSKLPALHLPSIANQRLYQQAVATNYASAPHGWLTPVELFSPHLSHAYANRIFSSSPHNSPVHVIEIGAGRGTLAKDVLNYFSSHNPRFLSRLKYTTVDVSPALSAIQERVLRSWIASDVAAVVCANATEWLSTFAPHPESHVHVVATEVLDNMPHDLVKVSTDGLSQAYVIADSPVSLTWEPDVDQDTYLAINTFNLTQSPSLQSPIAVLLDTVINGGSRHIWVPTFAFHLLRTLVSKIPTASLTISDFTYFPDCLPGLLAPVIQCVKKGTAIVYDGLECAPFGSVDIMFPTDFKSFSHAHTVLLSELNPLRKISRRPSFRRDIVTHENFFREFAPQNDVVNTTCRDGYNPVLQDFRNTAYLLIDAVDL